MQNLIIQLLGSFAGAYAAISFYSVFDTSQLGGERTVTNTPAKAQVSEVRDSLAADASRLEVNPQTILPRNTLSSAGQSQVRRSFEADEERQIQKNPQEESVSRRDFSATIPADPDSYILALPYSSSGGQINIGNPNLIAD